MLSKKAKFNEQKLTSLSLVLRTTNATHKTANIKISGREILIAIWVLTGYGGSTHERLLSESSRPHMLACRICVIYLVGRNRPWTILTR